MGNKFFMFTGFLLPLKLFSRLNVQHDVCIKFLGERNFFEKFKGSRKVRKCFYKFYKIKLIFRHFLKKKSKFFFKINLKIKNFNLLMDQKNFGRKPQEYTLTFK